MQRQHRSRFAPKHWKQNGDFVTLWSPSRPSSMWASYLPARRRSWSIRGGSYKVRLPNKYTSFTEGWSYVNLKKKLNRYEFNQILFLQFSRNHEISSRSQGTEWKNNKTSTRLILLPAVTSHWMLPLKGQTNLKFTTPLNKCACSFKSPNSALFQKFYL